MIEKFSVLTNVFLKPETKSEYKDSVFTFNCGNYHSLEEAELRAELLRKKYPTIRIAILNHHLQQIIEIC
jgi:hypothetical protein